MDIENLRPGEWALANGNYGSYNIPFSGDNAFICLGSKEDNGNTVSIILGGQSLHIGYKMKILGTWEGWRELNYG